MKYWVFTDDQLSLALEDWLASEPSQDEAEHKEQIIRDFLYSDTCRKEGMIRGEDQENHHA